MAAPPTIHERLRLARERAGMSEPEVIRAIGGAIAIQQGFIRRLRELEAGREHPDGGELMLLADLYGVSAKWLRTGHATPSELMRFSLEQRDGILRDAADVAAADPEYLALLAGRTVTLMCYCADETRCHRTVLAELLEGMA